MTRLSDPASMCRLFTLKAPESIPLPGEPAPRTLRSLARSFSLRPIAHSDVDLKYRDIVKKSRGIRDGSAAKARTPTSECILDDVFIRARAEHAAAAGPRPGDPTASPGRRCFESRYALTAGPDRPPSPVGASSIGPGGVCNVSIGLFRVLIGLFLGAKEEQLWTSHGLKSPVILNVSCFSSSHPASAGCFDSSVEVAELNRVPVNHNRSLTFRN